MIKVILCYCIFYGDKRKKQTCDKSYLVIKVKEVKIVKGVMACDVLQAFVSNYWFCSSYVATLNKMMTMMVTKKKKRGVPVPGIISLQLCQGSYLFLEATLSNHCPRDRAIQPGIHNLLLYERRLPETRHHI